MDALIRRLWKYGDDLGRLLREFGLERAAAAARAVLGESAPDGEWAAWEMAVLERVLERICRYEGDDLPDPATCDADDAVLAFVQTLPSSKRDELRALLALIEAGSLVEAPEGERERFTDLSAPAADAYLATWAESSVGVRRGAFQALKSLCAMGYWSREETWHAIGYSVDDNPGI